MTAKAIIGIALSLGAGPSDARLVDSLAVVESSRRTQIKGDKGAAWGLFQFHRARWEECGGAPAEWGKAGARPQIRAMLKSIRGQRRLWRKHGLRLSVEQQIIWIGRHHNIGHCKKGRGTHNRYTRKLWRAYRRNRK